MDRPLTPREEKFARAVAKGATASDAHRLAGYKATGKRGADSSRINARPAVAARIAELRGLVQHDFRLDMAAILRRLSEIALADPSELARPRRLNCRQCHGQDHEFQWIDQAEWARAVAAAQAKRKRPPEASGGFGFRHRNPPHPDCPACGGDGNLDVHIADLDTVSPAARKLYAGIKTTQNGVEVKMHDQMAVVDKIIRILGGYDDRVRMELTGRDGQAIQSLMGELSPDEAAALYRKAMTGGA